MDVATKLSRQTQHQENPRPGHIDTRSQNPQTSHGSQTSPGSQGGGTTIGGSTTAPVHVSFLLDRSGSMSGLETDVVNGFNKLLADQRKQPGDCRVTLVQFDTEDPFEVLLDAVSLQVAPDLTLDRYQPRGGTPLLDALGDLITSVDRRLQRQGNTPLWNTGSQLSEDQMIVVFTDGAENSSRRWKRSDLFDMITRRKQAGWSFVFMGANQDSYAEAGGIGFDAANVQNFRADSRGAESSFAALSLSAGRFRAAGGSARRRLSRDAFEGVKDAEDDLQQRGNP